jgi:hypothetical protein
LAHGLLLNGLETHDNYVARTIIAYRVFKATGHALWPWEVNELPDDWLDAFEEFAKLMERADGRG